MAQRRMFSLKIIDSDNFVSMPHSSRLYYYDLAMRADDDGFVDSPKKIMKMTGASEDDYKILCAKQFIIPFENGICVIKDWKIHNYIASDRYHETHYLNEKKQLTECNNGSYTTCIQPCIQNVDSGKVSLGKVSLGKSRKGKTKEFTPPTVQEVIDYFLENGYKQEIAEKAFKGYSAADWIDTRGNPVLNWKQKMVNVWFTEENKIKTELSSMDRAKIIVENQRKREEENARV